MNIDDFKDVFADWQTFWQDADIKYYNIVIESIGEESTYYHLYRIIGWTKIPKDILLHVIDMSNYADEELAIKASGIQFIRLSNIKKMTIYPSDQDFD